MPTPKKAIQDALYAKFVEAKDRLLELKKELQERLSAEVAKFVSYYGEELLSEIGFSPKLSLSSSDPVVMQPQVRSASQPERRRSRRSSAPKRKTVRKHKEGSVAAQLAELIPGIVAGYGGAEFTAVDVHTRLLQAGHGFSANNVSLYLSKHAKKMRLHVRKQTKPRRMNYYELK